MLFARFFLGAAFLGDADGALNDVLATSPSAMFSFSSTCAMVVLWRRVGCLVLRATKVNNGPGPQHTTSAD